MVRSIVTAESLLNVKIILCKIRKSRALNIYFSNLERTHPTTCMCSLVEQKQQLCLCGVKRPLIKKKLPGHYTLY